VANTFTALLRDILDSDRYCFTVGYLK